MLPCVDEYLIPNVIDVSDATLAAGIYELFVVA